MTLEENHSNSSTPPTQPSYTASTKNMQTFCKQMLKTRIFLGNFREKRYVSNLNVYRDIIVISPNETEFCHDMAIVRNRITHFQAKPIWTGYTSTTLDGVLSPASHCIWTDLDANIPFGNYWFQVKTIRFKDDETMIKVKMLRPLRSASNEMDNQMPTFSSSINGNSSSSEQQQQHTTDDNDSMDHSLPESTMRIAGNFWELFQMWCEDLHKSILRGLSAHCNVQNTIYCVKYMTVLIAALLTSSLYAVKHLGFFTLHFMAQSRELIRVLTPIIMGLLDLLTKLIGGFFILLAMIWRDCVGGGQSAKRSPSAYQSIMPPSRNNRSRYYAR